MMYYRATLLAYVFFWVGCLVSSFGQTYGGTEKWIFGLTEFAEFSIFILVIPLLVGFLAWLEHASGKNKHTLEQLLSGVTKDNIHSEDAGWEDS